MSNQRELLAQLAAGLRGLLLEHSNQLTKDKLSWMIGLLLDIDAIVIRDRFVATQKRLEAERDSSESNLERSFYEGLAEVSVSMSSPDYVGPGLPLSSARFEQADDCFKSIKIETRFTEMFQSIEDAEN